MATLFRNYTILKDRLTHPSCKGVPELRQKVHFAYDLMSLVFLSAISFGTYYYIIGYSSGWITDMALLVTLPILGYRLYKTANLLAFVNWLMFINLIAVIGLTYYSGTYLSPATTWLSLAIFSSFLVGNRKLGIIYSIIALLFLIVIYPLLTAILGIPETTFPEEHLLQYGLICNVGLIVIIFFSVLSYETVRLDLKKQLEVKQKQLVEAEKMASLGQLTAGIAHEMNNPVSFIKSGAQALRFDVEEIRGIFEDIKDLERNGNGVVLQNLEVFETLQEMNQLSLSIEKGSKRVKKIVESLSVFAYQSEHEKQAVSVNGILEGVLALLNGKIKEKQITVQTQFNSLPNILCHSSEISQVLMSIIENAIEAIDKDGVIKITTQDLGESLEVGIKDNGKGIAASIRKRIFDPFFTTKEVGQGMGLGLSISYGIIEQHGGTIRLETKEEEGSIFYILLPVN